MGIGKPRVGNEDDFQKIETIRGNQISRTAVESRNKNNRKKNTSCKGFKYVFLMC